MGLSMMPRILTPNVLGVLSRNSPSVVVFADGSASVPAERGGIGLVLKFGFFTVEIGRPIKSPASSYLAEISAIEAALDLFPDKRLFINSDCLNVVNMLSKGHVPKKIPKIVTRVREKLEQHGAEIRFWPRRSRAGAHNRADKLASLARTEGRNFFRISSV